MLTDQQHPGLETMLDHIEHAVNIVKAYRVGIGTDWGVTSPEFPQVLRAGMREVILGRSAQALGVRDPVPLGELDSYSNWVHITRGLVSRGYSDDEVRGILGGNFLSFLRRAFS